MPLPGSAQSSYPSLDALLANAKASLARANALDATVPQTAAPAPVSAPVAAPLPDDSIWGRIKRVANYSPLPEDVGEHFASDVDPTSARDAKALAGTYGPLDTLKSFLAGAGGGFLDELRATATPAGLGSLITPEGPVGRVASGLASGVFAGEGAEGLTSADPGTRARGLANMLLGGAGVLGAAHLGGEFPHGEPATRTPGNPDALPLSTTKPGAPERFAPNVSADAHAGDPGAVADHFAPTSAAEATPRQMADAAAIDLPFDSSAAASPDASPVASETSSDLPASTAPGKPRITADEFSGILKGRQKLAEANPDLALPPGARDELDRMGLEYGRTQRTLKQLLGMPDADPAEVARMNQGARELGSRLRSAVKGYTTPPANPLDALEAADRPDYAKVPFNVVDEATQSALPGQIDYAGAKLGRASLKDLIATQPTVTRDVVAQKFGAPPTELDSLPVGANTRPTGQIPEVVTGADGRNYLIGGTHTATAAMLRGEPDIQAVMYPIRGGNALAPDGLPADRVGHFTLPEANVPDAVYDKIRETKGIAPSPLATEAATTSGARAAGSNVLPFDPHAPITDASGREIAPAQGGDVERPAGPWDLNGTGQTPAPEATPAPTSTPESGFANMALLSKLLRVPAGAAAGAYFDPENRERGALVGGALGAASLAPGLSDRLERLRYFSMLAGPAPLKKALSDTGVALNAAGERAITHGPGEGLNVLKEFFSPTTAKDFASRVKGGGDPSVLMDRPQSTSYQGVLGTPPRLMGSATEATQGALGRAGVEDAARRTFTAEPETKAGKAALQFQRSSKVARLLLPFAKTAINQTEQGVLPFVRAAQAVQDGSGINRQLAAQLVTRLGAAGAGAALGSTDFADDHPTLATLATLLTGPGAIPALVGEGFSHALHNDKNEAQALSAAAGELRHGLPLPSEWATSPSELLASIAPAGLKYLNPDDEQHDTTGSVFGPLLARLPFLSDSLPVKGSGKPKKSLFGD